MIDLLDALSKLGAAIQTTDSLVSVYEWLKSKVSTSSAPPEVVRAIRALPADASAEQIAAVVTAFMGARGGDAELSAGDNGGGDVIVRDLDMAAGNGPGGGGKAVVRGGRGGPDGAGGRLILDRARIRGGNAS